MYRYKSTVNDKKQSDIIINLILILINYLTLNRPPGVKFDPSLRFFSDYFFGVSYNYTKFRDFVTTSFL
jgi:hypothetical protein